MKQKIKNNWKTITIALLAVLLAGSVVANVFLATGAARAKGPGNYQKEACLDQDQFQRGEQGQMPGNGQMPNGNGQQGQMPGSGQMPNGNGQQNQAPDSQMEQGQKPDTDEDQSSDKNDSTQDKNDDKSDSSKM